MIFVVPLLLICTHYTTGLSTYNFFRDLDIPPVLQNRRIFGGNAGDLNSFPAVCVLTDRNTKEKCTGSIITKRFVLTAGHCIKPTLALVVFNTRRTDSKNGHIAEITERYRHPRFEAVIKDEGNGLDVVQLSHDVGLVQVDRDMVLNTLPQKPDALVALRTLPETQTLTEVEVFGFGRTEEVSKGMELLSVKLQLAECGRSSWQPCVCATAQRGQAPRGVCVGDSGGPVVLDGSQIAVISMGPSSCSSTSDTSTTATSVFTNLASYVDIINDTIYDTPSRLKLQPLSLISTSNAVKHASASIVLICVLFMFSV